MVISGCTIGRKFDDMVTVAVGPGIAYDGNSLVRAIDSTDPIGMLDRGEAALALVQGAVPAKYGATLYSTSETVIMQGYLDPPITLTLEQAKAGTWPSVGSMPGPTPGAVVLGRLADLKPGWRAVPVGGVTPTPETVLSGEYPLQERVSLVYQPANKSIAERLVRPSADMPAPWARLTVAGDFMLARGVDRAMRENGTLYPVEKVKDHLASADLAFANLESPIGVKGAPLPGKSIWFRARPDAIDLLKAAGLDMVTIANNHIMDYDTENFLETLDLLDQASIPYVGGGRDLAGARHPRVLQAKAVKIAFLGYSQFADLFFDWSYPKSFAAQEGAPGVAGIKDEWLAEDINKARTMADVVAVTFHWGDEFQNYPNAEQKRLAHLSVDLGADLVLGYHPHAIQGLELYKGKFIAYSTGNFIMDRQDTDLARESMLLDFQVGPGGVRQVEVHPVWIRAEQPYIMTGAEGEQLLQKMRTISGWKHP